MSATTTVEGAAAGGDRRATATPSGRDRGATLIYALFGTAAAIGVVGFGYAIIAILPDGTSATASAAFYRDHAPLVRLAAAVAALCAVGIVWQSGALAARLWATDPSPRHTLSWIALVSDVVMFAVFFLEVGLFAATGLLVDEVSDEIIHALHVAAFTSAFVLGALWIPYFVAVARIGLRTGALPTWLIRLAIATAITNSFAIGAAFTLSGPFNGQNGIVALGGATFLPVTWLFLSSAWLVVRSRADDARQRSRA